MTFSVDLSNVPTSTLRQVRGAIERDEVRSPVHREGLLGLGVRHHITALERSLAGHSKPAAVAILSAVLSERERRPPSPELVWTGPEGPRATARDTAIVLRSLFESAGECVILAGYSFSHAHDVLKPLHEAMRTRNVEALCFINIDQVERSVSDPVAYARTQLQTFLQNNWPFGEPQPRLFYDTRATRPGPPYCSLHAKCVTVDGQRAFISSANFTQRGQERNIEAGVLIEDAAFATHLANQWMSLVHAGTLAELEC